MNCREAYEKIADHSVDALSETEARHLQEHLGKCPPCMQEWQLFHRTLLCISTAEQSVVDQEKSRAMWDACLRHIEEKTERERMAVQKNAFPWWRKTWTGWASLATSFAVLGAVWMFQPGATPITTSNVANGISNPRIVTAADSFDSSSANVEKTEWVSFETPSTLAAPYINHHALMAFDPFSDRVGTTLVADAAAILPVRRISAISDAAR